MTPTMTLRLLYKKLKALVARKDLARQSVLLLLERHARHKPTCVTALKAIIKTLTYARKRGAALPATPQAVVDAPQAALAARNARYREQHLQRATVYLSARELAAAALHEQDARKCKGGFVSAA